MTVEQVYGSVEAGGTSLPIVIGGQGGSSRGGSRSGGGSNTELGLRATIDRHNTAGQVKVSVYTDDPPATGDRLEVTLQDEQLFAGEITKAKPGVGGRVHLTAYDAARKLKQATLTKTYKRATLETVATDALDEAGVQGEINLPAEQISPEFSDTRADTILTKVASWGNGIWHVDATNRVHVTTATDAVSTRHELEQVISASPEDTLPPYQSVRVVGASPASRKGRRTTHMVASKPVIATAGEGDPQYTHRDEDIRTQSMADKAAESIRKELLRQRITGEIEIVGDPSIRPLDTVVLPPSEGGGEFLVTGVKHRLDDRDGYRTHITPGEVIL